MRWLEWRGAGVKAVFPTREGGVSRGPWESLNLGLSVGDDAGRALENRHRLCEAVGMPLERLVLAHQVHGQRILEIGDAEAGRGAAAVDDAVGEGDALLSSTPGLGLCVSTADCLPVVVVAQAGEGPVLAAVHAGWRGVLGGIAGDAAAALGSRGRLLGAVIGPSIGPCCFVVDDDLRARFTARFGDVVSGDAVDLWSAVTGQLVAAGVPRMNIIRSEVCTSCDRRFFSHRRDRGLTGRHLAIAWRREP